MATVTETNGTATTTKAKPFKGFAGLLCPECSSPDATVRMDLRTMECSCSECDAEFTAKEAAAKMAAHLAQWQAVCRWVDMAPTAL